MLYYNISFCHTSDYKSRLTADNIMKLNKAGEVFFFFKAILAISRSKTSLVSG